jgi:hypothetical protein
MVSCRTQHSPPPPSHTLPVYAVLWHREGGRGRRVVPERRLEGEQFTKLGRKYQHDWLYLQSIKSDKHLPHSPFTDHFLEDDILLWCLYKLFHELDSLWFLVIDINLKIINDVQVLGASERVRPLAPSCTSRTALRAMRPPSAHSWRPSRRAANWRPNSGRPRDRLVKNSRGQINLAPKKFLSRRRYLSSRTFREGILAKEVNKLTKFELENCKKIEKDNETVS